MAIFSITIIRELLKKGKIKEDSIIFIAMFGALIFYIFWEVCSRYSLTFLPWIIFIYGTGISYIEKLFSKDYLQYQGIKININIVNRIIAIVVVGISIFLMIKNYSKYTKEKDYYVDNVIVQNNDRAEKIGKLGNKVLKQTFITNKSFNSISIRFIKKYVKDITNYKFVLYNSNNEEITRQSFTSEDILRNPVKSFIFKKVKPKGRQKFKIKIYSKDATDEDSIGVSCFSAKGYKAYIDGKLTLDNEKVNADLTFWVQEKKQRTYMSKEIYVIMCVIIVLLEGFAFYPYFVKRKD